MKLEESKCPYCLSEAISIDNEFIEWTCGTKCDVTKSIILEPTKECKALIDERLKVKLTDVGQYVVGLKEIEDLFPDAVPAPINRLEPPIDPKKKEIIDLLGRLSNNSNL
jgi:hypothetical protein